MHKPLSRTFSTIASWSPASNPSSGDARTPQVMKAFGSCGTASLLPGGQNTFVVGDIVLKPVPNIDEAKPAARRERHWIAEVFVVHAATGS